MKLERAYSILEVKSINDDERIIEGIATTPTTDRMDDIVEPRGAKFKLPLPLLFQHRASEPVGAVTKAKVTNDGILITAQFAQVTEPASLKEELDRAWAMVKAKLVRGLSIGFQSIESSDIDGTWGRRFIEWDWLELSIVTIPANAEATITSIKQADQPFLRAASGDNAARRVVRLKSSPGVTGQTAATRKGKPVKTIKEMIAALEAARHAKAAELSEIAKLTTERGETMDAETGETFDTLKAEIASIDKDLKRYRELDEINKANAQPATENRTDAPLVPALSGLRVRSNLEPGVRFARWAQACIRGNFQPQNVLSAIQNDPVWMRSTPELALVAKTAIPAADTTTAGWAAELVYAENLASEFIEFLRPMTIIGRVPGLSRVPFNIRVGGLSSGLTGYWVGEGKPIPVSKGTTTSATLGITKAAGIASITKELARLSTPSAELMIRNELARAIQELLDDSFINPNNAGIANEKPASIIYGVAPVTPSGTTYAAMRTDIQTLMETSFDNNLGTAGSVWIMSQSIALKLSMMVNALDQRVNPELTATGGSFQGFPVIVSQKAQIAGSPQYGDIIIFLHPREIWLADDGGVTVEASDQVSLQLLDNPTNQSVGATVPTTVVSMYQTESIAIKGVRFINWGKRRTTAAQWIQAAAYVG